MKTLFNLFNKILDVNYIQLSEETASYAYEVVDGDTLYIYFEWSNGKRDWLNNFSFPAKPYKEMKDVWFVHRGFLRVWKVIEDHLKPYVEDKSINKIIIGGYSHGAALAALCHEYCVFHRPDIAKNIWGYGFGAPRVAFMLFNKRVKARFEQFYVIRNHTDLITHLPPVIFGFHHVGNLIRIGKKANYGMIKSHYPENYKAELDRADLRICIK